MARSNVPKFGTWENSGGGDVPYTVFFDQARKNRGNAARMINPNDPQDNPQMFANTKPPEPMPRQFNDARGRNDNMAPNNDSPRVRKTRMGSELSFGRSPLHQANLNAWEGSSRPRRPVRPEQTPEKGTAVPPFGGWNETDPQAAENFTDIFNKVREERKVAGTGNANATPKHPSYIRNQPPNKPKKLCCFPWW